MEKYTMRALAASPPAWLQERNTPARRFACAGGGSQEDGGVWVLNAGCLGVVLSGVWVFCVAVFPPFCRFLPLLISSGCRFRQPAGLSVACSVAATAGSQVRRQQRVGVGVWGTSRGVGCRDLAGGRMVE